MTIKASYGQNLFDICIMQYGGLDHMKDLVRRNTLNFDDELTTGQDLSQSTTTITQQTKELRTRDFIIENNLNLNN